MPERDRYQWEDCAFPLWHRLVKLADEVGVEKYALENFSAMLVWNPETLFRLRNEVGPKVGMNLDPSHLFWKGADPIAGARALGKAHPPLPRQGHPHRARAGRRQRPAGAQGRR